MYPFTVTTAIFNPNCDGVAVGEQYQLSAASRHELLELLSEQFEREGLEDLVVMLERGRAVVTYYGGAVDAVLLPVQTVVLVRRRLEM